MASPDICFLFNAHSNSGRSIRCEEDLRHRVKSQWPKAEFITTETGNPFWEKLPDQLRGVSTIIACGGDGTIHKAGNLAVRLNATLGVIPIGSGNDFAHLMNIPKSISAAFNHLNQSGRRHIDIIKVEGDIECYCMNTVGVGLDGLGNHYTNIYKKKIGKAGYFAGALKAIFVSREFELSLSIDGKCRTERLLMITSCNGQREGGSFWVAPEAEPDDGLIDLLLLHPMSKPVRLLALPTFLFSGLNRGVKSERHRCKTVRIECKKPLFIHVDGEYSNTKIEHVSLSIQESALQVIA